MLKKFRFKPSVDLHQYGGLDYLTVNVPILRVENNGKSIDSTDLNVNRTVAKTMIRKKVPIHGQEIKFFRENTLKMTQQQFGHALGISSIAILKWEQQKKKRLHRINEAAVLLLMIEKLQLKMRVRLSDLSSNSDIAATPQIRVVISRS